MGTSSIYDWLFVFGVAGLAVQVGASIIDRTRKGKPIFPKIPPNALFGERGVSGRTPGVLIGSRNADRCLIVAVTEQDLLISPMFPFTLMFAPERFGIEFRIPLNTIRFTELETDFFYGKCLDITYFTDRTRKYRLKVKDIDGLMQALQASQSSPRVQRS